MAIPSKDFYAAFGAIAHWYAQVEFGVKATIGGILDLHIDDVQILEQLPS